MKQVIGVTYRKYAQSHLVQTQEAYPIGTQVLIKEGKAIYLGEVNEPARMMADKEVPKQLPRCLRRAKAKDIQAATANDYAAKASYAKVQALLQSNQLTVKLQEIIFPLDRQFVLITFASDKRVDFRNLLKDLAAYFRMRIELQQINSRAQARISGGLGPCGRPLCCSSFLGEFPKLSIKMAKNQNLSLSSGKSSGYCGHLLCCLQYEDQFYQESKAKFPDFGQTVLTKDGQAIVTGIDIFNDVVAVRFFDHYPIVHYALEEVTISG
ncbi:regulatory iron-sulfur-containing complex subunit RicT [Streptococcus halichoeri]|uniref:regulatory iron-sulfur-containing complex subunit RicT n=1 Tax=Streptococcus halichoeri TaxID=254785 RepID=UPI00135A4CE4|nr:regulatory iron-sulfur-containing complex subunit RicT [Streptococcus halichoeri]